MMDRKKLAAIIAVGPKGPPDEEAPEAEAPPEADDLDVEMGHDLLDAIRDGDAAAVVDAIKAIVGSPDSEE